MPRFGVLLLCFNEVGAALAGRERLTGAGFPVTQATAILHRLAYTRQRLAIASPTSGTGGRWIEVTSA